MDQLNTLPYGEVLSIGDVSHSELDPMVTYLQAVLNENISIRARLHERQMFLQLIVDISKTHPHRSLTNLAQQLLTGNEPFYTSPANERDNLLNPRDHVFGNGLVLNVAFGLGTMGGNYYFNHTEYAETDGDSPFTLEERPYDSISMLAGGVQDKVGEYQRDNGGVVVRPHLFTVPGREAVFVHGKKSKRNLRTLDTFLSGPYLGNIAVSSLFPEDDYYIRGLTPKERGKFKRAYNRLK